MDEKANILSPLFSFFYSLGEDKHESLTRALLLVTGSDLLPGALAGVALHPRPFTHPEAALPAGVARLAAQTPVVPAAPVTST